MAARRLTVTLCGAGNGTHVAAGVLGKRSDVTINVLTRRPEIFTRDGPNTNIPMKLTEQDGTVTDGRIDKVSADPAEVIPQADVVCIFSPVGAYEPILHNIRPFVKKGARVGAMFSQAHVDLMVHSLIPADREVTAFSTQYIPWQAKLIEVGRHAHLVGAKSELLVSTSLPQGRRGPGQSDTELLDIFSDLFGMPCYENPFIATTLTTSNQILHPARYFNRFGDWDGVTPFEDDGGFGPGSLYSDMCAASAATLDTLNAELMTVKEDLQNRYNINLEHALPLAERIERQYGDQVDDYSSTQRLFNTAHMYNKSKFAMKKVDGGVVPDTNHRHFTDDIPFGIVTVKQVAEQLGTPTPEIDRQIAWHQKYMGREFIRGDKLDGKDLHKTGAMCRYGVTLEDYLAQNYSFTHLPAKKNVAPKDSECLIVFDVDHCLWNMESEEVRNMGLSDEQLEAKLYPDVKDILKAVTKAGYPVAFASRCWYPYVMEEYMTRLGWADIPCSSQIYATGPNRPGFQDEKQDKRLHFTKIHEETGIDYSNMIFFDDVTANVEFARDFGLNAVHTPEGMSWAKLEEGLRLKNYGGAWESISAQR